MMLHTKHQRSRTYGFRQDFFSCFPLYKPTCDPRGGPVLAPGINLNTFGRSLLGDTTNQNIKALGLMVSDKICFNVSPYLSICKQCDHRGII